MAPLIAVCVCTRARPQMARRCLASLSRQQFDPARLRMLVILIDNNPHPTARPIYEEFHAIRPSARFVHCPKPGIPMARNAALDAALGVGADYIAFLDDDEVAPAHWLQSLLQALETADADAVQGGVRQLPAGSFERATTAAAPPQGKIAWEPSESLATCNTLFRARLVQPPRSLRFDETMQFTGGSDREFFMRAHKRGARLLRVHGIDVLEEVAPGRETLAYRATRSYAAGSNYFLRVLKNEPRYVAVSRIGLRALDRSVNGIVQILLAAGLMLVLRRHSALKQWRDGCASLCFAGGCLTPLVGVRAYPYRKIKGT